MINKPKIRSNATETGNFRIKPLVWFVSVLMVAVVPQAGVSNGGQVDNRSGIWKGKNGEKALYYTDHIGDYHAQAYDKARAKHYSFNEYKGGTTNIDGKPVANEIAPHVREVKKSQGATIVSGFRSFSYQATLKGGKPNPSAEDWRVPAPGGFSEHHTGYAIDFSDASRSLNNTPWFTSPMLKKLHKHLQQHPHWEQSFRAETPSGLGRDNSSRSASGILVENWHWRWKGSQAAIKALTPNKSGKPSSVTETAPPSTQGNVHMQANGALPVKPPTYHKAGDKEYTYDEANEHFKQFGKLPGIEPLLLPLNVPNGSKITSPGRFGEQRTGAGSSVVYLAGHELHSGRGATVVAGDSGKVVGSSSIDNSIVIERNNRGRSPELKHQYRYVNMRHANLAKNGTNIQVGQKLGDEKKNNSGDYFRLEYYVPKSQARNIALRFTGPQDYQIDGVGKANNYEGSMIPTDPTPYLNIDVIYTGKDEGYKKYLGNSWRTQYNALYGTQLPVGAGAIKPTAKIPDTFLTQLNSQYSMGLRLTPEELAAAKGSVVDAAVAGGAAGFDVSGQWVSQAVLASMLLVDDGKDFMSLESETRDLQLTDKSPKHIIDTIGKSRYGNLKWLQGITTLNSKGMFNEYVQMMAEENYIRERNLDLKRRIEALYATLASVKQHEQMKKIEKLQGAIGVETIPTIIEQKLEASGDEWIGGGSSGGMHCVPADSSGAVTSSSSDFLAFGDSIAVGVHGKSTKVDGFAWGGKDSSYVLAMVQAKKSIIKGQNVVLSTGMTNDIANTIASTKTESGVPSARTKQNIEKQLQELKNAGAAKIVVLGVSETLYGNHKEGGKAPGRETPWRITPSKVAEVNNWLKSIAAQYGASFVSWKAPVGGGDGMHAAQSTYLAAIKSQAGLSGKPTTTPVAGGATVTSTSNTSTTPAPTTQSSRGNFGNVHAGAKAVGITHYQYNEAKQSELAEIPQRYRSGGGQNRYIHRDALASLSKMIDESPHQLRVASAFRSVAYQRGLKGGKPNAGASAWKSSAPAGYSEHHTGFAVDFSPVNTSFGNTAAYRWLKNNAHKYGWYQTFTASYSKQAGIIEEAWHWRYLGSSTAKAALTPVGGSAIPGGDGNGSTVPNISGGSGSPAATSAPFVNEHGQVCTPVGDGSHGVSSAGDGATPENSTTKGPVASGGLSSSDNPSTSSLASKAADIATSRSLGLGKSAGRCALYVRIALQNAGYKVSGGLGHAWEYNKNMPRLGFSQISATNYVPQKGDVIVFDKTKKHPWGHVQIFNGTHWVSDHTQRTISPYKARDSHGTMTIYRDLNKN